MSSHSHRPSSNFKQSNKKHLKKGPSKLGRIKFASLAGLKDIDVSKNGVSVSKKSVKGKTKLKIQEDKYKLSQINRLFASDDIPVPPRRLILLPVHNSVTNEHLIHIKDQLVETWHEGKPIHQGILGVAGPVGMQLQKTMKNIHKKGEKKNPQKHRLIVSEVPQVAALEGESHEDYTTRKLLAYLDVVKTADILVVVFRDGPKMKEIPLDDPSVSAIDAFGYEIIQAVKAQATPTVVGIRSEGSSDDQESKNIKRYFETEFPGRKFFHVSSNGINFLRHVVEVPITYHAYKDKRGYMDCSHMSHSNGILRLGGYGRGIGFSCQSLIHITGIGNFVISGIYHTEDPVPYEPIHDAITSVAKHLYAACPAAGEGLEIMDKNILSGEDILSLCQHTATGDDGAISPDEILSWDPINQGPLQRAAAEGKGDIGEEDIDDSVDNEDVFIRPEVEKDILTRFNEEMDFPDEVDTPAGFASEEFREYRGLSSVRHGDWENMEAVPSYYGDLHRIPEFHRMMELSNHDMVNKCFSVPGRTTGKWIYIDIPMDDETFNMILVRNSGLSWVPIIISTLHMLETKLSLIDLKIKRRIDESRIIQPMDRMYIQSGFRRFDIQPVFYTQLLNTKSERGLARKFLEPSMQLLAVAPCIDPVCNVLYFLNGPTGADIENGGSAAATDAFYTPFFATGGVLDSNTQKLLLDRVTLTGYPLKVHKRTSTIRFMFHNPEDVKYFKPVELRSRSGKRGHIRSSIGKKGHFKAEFNDPIDHGDIVCLDLYKRSHPTYTEINKFILNEDHVLNMLK